MRLATSYFWSWLYSIQLTEGRHWLARLLEQETDETLLPLRAAAHREHGWLAFLQGDYAVAERAYDEVLSLPESPEYANDRAFALYGRGILAGNREEYDRAEALFAEAVALARAHGGDPFLVDGVFEGRAILAGLCGDDATAERLLAEDLARFRERGDEWGLVTSLGNLAETLRHQGKIREAAALNREHLAISQKLDFLFGLADCCTQAAEGSLRLGQPERAARLASAAAKVREEVPLPGDAGYQRECAAIKAAIRAAVDDDVFAREWAAGQAMSLEASLAEADAVFAEEETVPEPYSSPLDPATAHGLTPRETEVLRLIAKDWSNQQIADHLFLSRRTVHKHVENILGKLGVDSRAGAAVWAVRNGIE